MGRNTLDNSLMTSFHRRDRKGNTDQQKIHCENHRLCVTGRNAMHTYDLTNAQEAHVSHADDEFKICGNKGVTCCPILF